MIENNTNRFKIYLNKYQIIQSKFIFTNLINKLNYLPIKYKKSFTKIININSNFKI